MTRIALCYTATAFAASLHANLIQNGSFEQPGFDPSLPFLNVAAGSNLVEGWTAIEQGFDWHNGIQFQNIYDGDFVVDLTSGAALGGISQSFATVLGKVYQLTFAMAAPSAPNFEDPRSLTVEIAGLNQSFFQSASDPLALIWSSKVLEFTATDAITTLSFRGSGNGEYWGALIDSVSVTAVDSSVPENGGTIALALIGLAPLLALRYRA